MAKERQPHPGYKRGDVVNVEGIGDKMTVASIKPGKTIWWLEVRLPDGRTWSVPQDRVWR